MTDRAGETWGRRWFIGAACIGFILSIISCLGVEASITVNVNGSGRAAFQYRVSKMFMSLKRNPGGAERPGLALPSARQDLERTLARAKGASLAGVQQTETEADIDLKGEIRFDSVAALNACGLFDEMPIALVREEGRTIFTLRVCDQREPLDQTAVETYRTLFEGYDLVFRITAPREIVSPVPSRGSLSADKKTLIYAISLFDYIQLSEKTEVRVSW
ncbi:MAG: hypothetical protein JXD23_17480 [Spirochaetales bacterium]|nr:hypothetical protein [Spirochaetales bacterium]